MLEKLYLHFTRRSFGSYQFDEELRFFVTQIQQKHGHYELPSYPIQHSSTKKFKIKFILRQNFKGNKYLQSFQKLESVFLYLQLYWSRY